MTGNILALGLLVLLITVESSLQTSIIWNRSGAWTAWLYKVGPFSVADIIIIAVAFYVLLKLLVKPAIKNSPYIWLCLFAVFYLCIGFVYNVGVFTLWKTYLYDVKVVLYLLVPYLFLYLNRKRNNITRLFTPLRIFAYVAVATLIDFIVVRLYGHSEYPEVLGFPAIRPLVPMTVIIVGIVFSRKPVYMLAFLALLTFELFSALNKLSLGVLLGVITSLFYIFVLRLRFNFGMRFLAISTAFVLINLGALIIVYDPFEWSFISAKSSGVQTRQIQMANALENFKHNIPGVIGKGLGSTWFEYIPIPKSDIYSVGTSVGATSETAMAMPVKFVFNFGLPSLLHKWGILGSIILFLLLTRYFHLNYLKIRGFRDAEVSRQRLRYFAAVLFLSSLCLLEVFTYVGNLKASLIASLLAFYTENQMGTQPQSVVSPG